MKEIFIFSDWELITSGVEIQMRAEGTRYTDEGVERIKARIRFFNGSKNPELRLRRYNAGGVMVEDAYFKDDSRPYDVFKTFYGQVRRMESGEALEVVD